MQSPKELIMVRPAAFGYDPETAESNVFQNKPLNGDHDNFQEKAVKEFDNAVLELQSNGVRVTIFDEDVTDSVKKPDNWIFLIRSVFLDHQTIPQEMKAYMLLHALYHVKLIEKELFTSSDDNKEAFFLYFIL